MVDILHLEGCTDRIWDRMHEHEYLGDWMGYSLQIYLSRGSCQLYISSN